MKLYLQATSRRPIGLLLGELMRTCDAYGRTEARRVSLDGKHVLPQDLAARASRVTTGDSQISYNWGELDATWRYGPTAWGQSVNVTISCRRQATAAATEFFSQLCSLLRADYGFADREAAVQRESDSAFERKRSLMPSDSFYCLFWYNYFGASYRSELPVSALVRKSVYQLSESADGGLVVLLTEVPGIEPRPEKIDVLLAEWPVFGKYMPAHRFRAPIELDYSELRALGGMPKTVPVLEQPVGDAGDFISKAPARRRRFEEWLREKGVQVSRENDVLEAIWRNADEIDADEELLLSAHAAYGEMVRERIGGEWAKAIVGNAEEPVIKKPWQPWRTRWVINEVTETLDMPREEDL